ncbi:MAG TPA: tripartite tricarboxylate transporter substrate binding protein, partial [Thermodesulfobacteriota bacterium]|nr:tripartite tricarboxylate transporter substrate binding protein [Thermodesulfobacteriota bacterium]
MKRSIYLAGFLVFAYGFILGVSTSPAQSFPSRPIQLIIPNVPGSIMDINARVLSAELGRLLGTQIIVVAKPGGASIFGTDFVAKSKKDGYTIGYLSASGLIYTRITHPETFPYDPDKDLEPLGLHLFVPLTAAVQASSPWKTFDELIDYAKRNPGKLRVSTIGVGAIDHFNLEVMQAMTGAQFTMIPFKGGESVITALLGGHVEVTFDAFGKVIPHVDSGQLRILLVSKKMPGYPHIPTAAEFGYKQGLLSTWFGFYGPSGLPEEVKRSLVLAIEGAVKNPELK